MKRKQKMRSFVYLTIGLAMLFFALPHPNMPTVTLSLEGAFTMTWLAFALLIIGSNLYYLIGVDREEQASKARRLQLMKMLRKRDARYDQAPQQRRRRYLS